MSDYFLHDRAVIQIDYGIDHCQVQIDNKLLYRATKEEFQYFIKEFLGNAIRYFNRHTIRGYQEALADKDKEIAELHRKIDELKRSKEAII